MHHKLAQKFVRCVNRGSIKNKLHLSRVLFNKAQSELVILEQMRAQIAHGHTLGLRPLDQATDGTLVENNLQSMFLAEFLCEFTCASFEHLRLKLVSFNHKLLK